MVREYVRSTFRSAGFAAALFFFAFPILGQVPGEIDSLASAVRSGTVEEKRDALYRLRIIGTPDASRAAVLALSDPEPIVRATAAGSLAALPSPEAVAALLPLLNDNKDFVRKEAVIALGDSGDNSAEEYLLRTLEEDNEDSVRAAATQALGEVGTGASFPSLTKVLTQKPKDKRQAVRRSAARSVGQIAARMWNFKVSDTNPESFLVSDTNPESFLPSKYKMSRSPLMDLTTIDHGAAGIALVLRRILISDRERSDTKREAAFALGAIGDRNSIPVLEACSVSEDPYLSESCKEALAKLR